MSIGTSVEEAILNCYFNQANITAPTAIFMSLHTADPGETGANELPNAEAYARVNVTAKFPTATGGGGALSNDAEILFPEAGGDGWPAATHAAIWTSGTYGAGTFVWGGALTVAKTAGVGVAIRFPIGDLDITLD